MLGVQNLIVIAYEETYKLLVNITRCSNNYGPSKMPKDLGQYLETDFETGIRKTVKGYLEN